MIQDTREKSEMKKHFRYGVNVASRSDAKLSDRSRCCDTTPNGQALQTELIKSFEAGFDSVWKRRES